MERHVRNLHTRPTHKIDALDSNRLVAFIDHVNVELVAFIGHNSRPWGRTYEYEPTLVVS